MNWIDYLLLIVIGCSLITGFVAGFARVVVGTAATFIAIFAGFWCYGIAGDHVMDYVNSRPVANLIGFFLIFVGIVAAGAVVGRLLARIFKWIGLSWLDRLLGGAFGAVRGLLIAAALTTVLVAFAPVPAPPSIVDSKMLPYVVGASSVLAYATPHEIKEAFHDAKDKVKLAWAEHLNRKPAP